jgi:hypothetical protein
VTRYARRLQHSTDDDDDTAVLPQLPVCAAPRSVSATSATTIVRSNDNVFGSRAQKRLIRDELSMKPRVLGLDLYCHSQTYFATFFQHLRFEHQIKCNFWIR